jgi:hypothetical protein
MLGCDFTAWVTGAIMAQAPGKSAGGISGPGIPQLNLVTKTESAEAD